MVTIDSNCLACVAAVLAGLPSQAATLALHCSHISSVLSDSDLSSVSGNIAQPDLWVGANLPGRPAVQ